MDDTITFRICGPHVAHQTIDGEAVILDLKKGHYYSLVRAGADIWNLALEGRNQLKIAQEITRRYDASPETIQKSVIEIIASLEKEGLIIRESLAKHPNEMAEYHNGPAAPKIPFEAPPLQKFTDMEELLLLDPIHEVDEAGWPSPKKEQARSD